MNTFRSIPKRFISFLPACILVCSFYKTYAQTDSTGRVRIAVLAPLYLDSAFNNAAYKLSNTNIPQYILPGLEFYNGVMMAIDSMQKQGANMDVWVYDTKTAGETPESLTAKLQPMHFSLIIASITNVQEQKTFSSFAFDNNVPFISATYPNDAYVSSNPFFLMINSTLQTHIRGLYKFVQRHYPVAQFIFLSRQGSMEQRIANLFTEVGKKTYPISYKTVLLNDNFTTDQVLSQLDSTKQNVIICGILDENFGTKIIQALDQNAAYPITVIGMPTWDGLRAAYTTTNENLSIVCSTPYNYPKTDSAISSIIQEYTEKFDARPSDMVFKGFETMFYFGNMELKYHNDLLNNLSDKHFRLSDNYLFEPVKLNPDSAIPDYIENKKLYFKTISQGKVVSVN